MMYCVCVREGIDRDNKINSAKLEDLGTSHTIIRYNILIVLPPHTSYPLSSKDKHLIFLLFLSSFTLQKTLPKSYYQFLQLFHKYMYILYLFMYVHIHNYTTTG